ncbi:hypothetical protein EF919_37800 [Streptomyces sp. WAC02707]|uniref:replication-relaxation family protein n=1 Tax=Streptomyces sp. WAC02707 TaxID=2487417 RepID=UPI000F76CBCF|nr:replication-relaxation family protein [Streptomyces sp. WAC02707]RSS85687.1 hypothetical protein EF919_37800 [Streptomyces sp. WAC02707]
MSRVQRPLVQALPVGGTFLSPARGSLRADMVFASPGHDVPLLFVEVDNGSEGPGIVADKVARYRRFFARRVPAHSGTGLEVPLWRTVWLDSPRDGHPPVVLVFTKTMSEEAMLTRMREIGSLAREHWRGEWIADYAPKGEKPDGYRDYQGTIPLLATTLRQLAAHGPHGPVWWRYGHPVLQSLTDALDNPDDYRAYSVRDQARRQAEQERKNREYEARRRALEAAKWTCPTCQHSVYPDDDLTPGGECRPCLNDRRAAAEAAPEQPPARGGLFGRRRRT